MLIRFSVGNYLSFKDIETFDLTTLNRAKGYKEENVIKAERYNLLKSAVIFGANASGKSNLLKAMLYMKGHVINPDSMLQSNDVIKLDQFKLSTETTNEPSFFEIEFLIDKIKYRYGFETKIGDITNEWLYCAEKIQEKVLFIRENAIFEISKHFKEGLDLQDKTRPDVLFLWVVAQFNGEISNKIISWFKNFSIVPTLVDPSLYNLLFNLLKQEEYRSIISQFLRLADTGIEDINLEEILFSKTDPPPGIPEEILNRIKDDSKTSRQLKLLATHRQFDLAGNTANLVDFNFETDESAGTKNFLLLIGLIIETIKLGAILFIDELDAILHPFLTQVIISLFNSNKTNPKNAQLVFTTFNTDLLSTGILRRDQFWFVEKSFENYTKLYCLAEYKINSKSIRKDASFREGYLNGRFGGVPSIGDIQKEFEKFLLWQKDNLKAEKV